MKYAFNRPNLPPGPKEPLYYLDEIADRLDTSGSKLRLLMGRHKPCPQPANFRSQTRANRHQYRLSDFKAWYGRIHTLSN